MLSAIPRTPLYDRLKLAGRPDENDDPAAVVTYTQEDQMARPAINTVFVDAANKDKFNTTIPSLQGAAFAASFNTRLLALNPGYTTNLLGLSSTDFTSILATDVLTVGLSGPTTFYDGMNVLTGRALADDVFAAAWNEGRDDELDAAIRQATEVRGEAVPAGIV